MPLTRLNLRISCNYYVICLMQLLKDATGSSASLALNHLSTTVTCRRPSVRSRMYVRSAEKPSSTVIALVLMYLDKTNQMVHGCS
jgi:hypothetical protein